MKRRLNQNETEKRPIAGNTRGQTTQLGVPYGLEKERVGLWSGSIEKVEKSVLEMLTNSHNLQLSAQIPNTGNVLTHQRARPPYAPKTISNGPLGQARRSTAVENNGAVPLSSRETEVVQLLAGGKSNKEISTALNISVKTVETYRARIMLKLQLHSTGDLVMHAVRHGIVKV